MAFKTVKELVAKAKEDFAQFVCTRYYTLNTESSSVKIRISDHKANVHNESNHGTTDISFVIDENDSICSKPNHGKISHSNEWRIGNDLDPMENWTTLDDAIEHLI